MLLLLPILYFFVIGAIIGSFINVLIDRIPRGMSIVLSRSYCPHCRKKLSPLELIPIFSYLMLRGKCGSCKKKIPARLLLIEVLIAVLYGLLYLMVFTSAINLGQFAYLLVILPLFISVIFTDLEYGIIPDQILLFILVASLSYFLLFARGEFVWDLLSAFIVFLFFAFLFFVTSGRGMGFGDVKLSFILGLFLGPVNVIVSLYLAFLTGAFVSIILVVFKKRSFRGGTIPFGPFLIVSSVVAYFWGDTLIKIFLRLY